MSKKMTKLVLALGAMAMAGGVMAASVDASATATVVTAIQISKDADLVFGKFVADATRADTIAISAYGEARTTGAGIVILAPGDNNPALFTVSGTADSSFEIKMPTEITITSSANSMAVNRFESFLITGAGTSRNLGEMGKLTSLTPGSIVTQKFRVGATLNVTAAQPTGTYTGTFTVTVNYL